MTIYVTKNMFMNFIIFVRVATYRNYKMYKQTCTLVEEQNLLVSQDFPL